MESSVESFSGNVYHSNLGILEKINTGKISIITHDGGRMFIIIIVLTSFNLIAF